MRRRRRATLSTRGGILPAHAFARAFRGFGLKGPALKEIQGARDELAARLLLPPARWLRATKAHGLRGLGNITGVGIGEKQVGGLPTGQIALKVFVREKQGVAAIDRLARVPGKVGTIPTDVEVSGEVSPRRFIERYRPARGGQSIGNATRSNPGTFGCLVRSRGRSYVLGNNHVLALENQAPPGSDIVQPARMDGGAAPDDVIASLGDFVPIDFNGVNQVDAAIAEAVAGEVDALIHRPSGPQRLVSPDLPPALGMLVQKSGRTTQYRRGQIDVVHLTLNVTYSQGVAQFAHQFRVRGTGGLFSEPGDSGALVTTYPGNQPVGLLFAGSTADDMTFCNDIARVTAALGVSIVY